MLQLLSLAKCFTIQKSCTITNTECKPNTICHHLLNKFGRNRFRIVQLLSRAKCFSIQKEIIHNNLGEFT